MFSLRAARTLPRVARLTAHSDLSTGTAASTPSVRCVTSAPRLFAGSNIFAFARTRAEPTRENQREGESKREPRRENRRVRDDARIAPAARRPLAIVNARVAHKKVCPLKLRATLCVPEREYDSIEGHMRHISDIIEACSCADRRHVHVQCAKRVTLEHNFLGVVGSCSQTRLYIYCC